MINIKKIKPMFVSVVTTMDVFEETGNKLIDTNEQAGSVKPFQKVVAIGDSVRGVNVGDIVSINPTRFAVKQHPKNSLKDGIACDNPIITFNFDTIELDGVAHLLIQDRDIDFVIEEYNEVPDNPEVIVN